MRPIYFVEGWHPHLRAWQEMGRFELPSQAERFARLLELPEDGRVAGDVSHPWFCIERAWRISREEVEVTSHDERCDLHSWPYGLTTDGIHFVVDSVSVDDRRRRSLMDARAVCLDEERKAGHLATLREKLDLDVVIAFVDFLEGQSSQDDLDAVVDQAVANLSHHMSLRGRVAPRPNFMAFEPDALAPKPPSDRRKAQCVSPARAPFFSDGGVGRKLLA